jgi:hypothetical protein
VKFTFSPSYAQLAFCAWLLTLRQSSLEYATLVRRSHRRSSLYRLDVEVYALLILVLNSKLLDSFLHVVWSSRRNG